MGAIRNYNPQVNQFGWPVPLAQGEDARAASCGLIAWNGDPGVFSTASGVLTSQKVYASSIFIPPGQNISNIYLNVQTAGSGTAPTKFFVGIADSTGTLLAKSAESSPPMPSVFGQR